MSFNTRQHGNTCHIQYTVTRPHTISPLELTDLAWMAMVAPQLVALAYRERAALRMRVGGDVDVFELYNQERATDADNDKDKGRTTAAVDNDKDKGSTTATDGDDFDLVVEFMDQQPLEREYHALFHGTNAPSIASAIGNARPPSKRRRGGASGGGTTGRKKADAIAEPAISPTRLRKTAKRAKAKTMAMMVMERKEALTAAFERWYAGLTAVDNAGATATDVIGDNADSSNGSKESFDILAWTQRARAWLPARPESVSPVLAKRHLQATTLLSLDAVVPEACTSNALADHASESDDPPIVAALKRQPFYTDQLLFHRSLPAKQPLHRNATFTVDKRLAMGIRAMCNIDIHTQLYAHQAAALHEIMERGRSVVVSTSTSSGKSLIYNVPVVAAILQAMDEGRPVVPTAMFMFPTKALAQDQTTKIRHLLDACGLTNISVDTYDGDTPHDRRAHIRNDTHILITNPDMLHVSILPHHHLWHRFLAALRFVIVDELHVYGGTFGSHVALILRRLKRMLVYKYADGGRLPVFIACSATVANPLEHARALLHVVTASAKNEAKVPATGTVSTITTIAPHCIAIDPPLTAITVDGSPTGPKDFLVWRTSTDDAHLFTDVARLLVLGMRSGLKSVVFCKVRASCEMVLKEARAMLQMDKELWGLREKLRGYRGGYRAELRREIEAGLFGGSITGVVATNALELGIDVGDLDVTIHLGFPGSLASLWQQAGRAGRRCKRSAAILVLSDDPVDAFYARSPELLVEKVYERTVLNPDAHPLLDQHLQCAAAEMMIRLPHDEYWFGLETKTTCEKALLQGNESDFVCPYHLQPNPALRIPIRCANAEMVRLIDATTNQLIEELELARAIFHLYEGAVYLHEGCTYIVEHVDLSTVDPDRRQAHLRPSAVDYITRQRDYTDVDAMGVRGSAKVGEVHAYFGEVRVTSLVYGYHKYCPRKHVFLETVDVYSPPYVRWSMGFWVDDMTLPSVPAAAIEEVDDIGVDLEAAIHGASHAITNLLPRLVLCSTTDISTEHKSKHQTRNRPARLIIYDQCGSVGGTCRAAFDNIGRLLNEAFIAVESCSCEVKCPRCCLSTWCTEFNELVDKQGALIILRHVVKGAGPSAGDAWEGDLTNGKVLNDAAEIAPL